MVSRVLYGMASSGHAPAFLGRVHPVSRTPVTATLITILIIAVLATWFPLLTLAKITSFVILAIFTLINLSLVRLKLRGSISRRGLWVPSMGALLSVSLIVLSAV
jgi:amino acid transporter